MMAELRQRLNGDAEAGSLAQDALFRMTILFERSVWLARRLVTDMSQAHQLLIE
jgi:phosphate:Na+ symporter